MASGHSSSDLSSSVIINKASTHNGLVIVSPLLVVALGSLAARLSITLFGKWAWAGTMPVYWLSMIALIWLLADRSQVAGWFGKSRGGFIWPAVAILVGLSAFPMLLLPNSSLLRTPLMALLWLAFGLINGTLEEVYWRGFLFREIRGLPSWVVVAYSSVLFIAIHFLMLGAFSPALFNLPFLVILVGITAIYAVMFIKTGSLRWPVTSHILTDWGNMNIFVFMNMVHLI